MSTANAISAKLLDYSRKYKVNHQMILIRFFHERLLFRVSVSEFKNHLLLKGGNLLYSIQGDIARPTVDVDFSGNIISNDIEEIKKIFLQILTIKSNDGVIFNAETLHASEINEQNQYTGVRVKVIAQLANIKQNIQIDIGFGDVITPAPQTLHYPILLEDFEVPVIQAYTIETVIAEKLQAIIILAQLNSRMKDFYDIYSLLKSEKINLEVVKEAITQTFNNRNTPVNFDSIVFKEEFYTDANRLKMWKAFLTKIKAESISFETVIKTIEQLVKDVFK
jgi:predicted nucleotidyltransferase component of viral defense system